MSSELSDREIMLICFDRVLIFGEGYVSRLIENDSQNFYYGYLLFQPEKTHPKIDPAYVHLLIDEGWLEEYTSKHNGTLKVWKATTKGLKPFEDTKELAWTRKLLFFS
jgi:hypothetical protein